MEYWVVPHTHWDREWYLQFEHFRFHLARTVDEVVEVLETDESYRCFTLDGQAAVVDDYLEVRPECEERLRSLVASGRIAIGPWYTLSDEFLVAAESLVRNLLAGRRACGRLGPAMAVGYLPDTFGHVAQLPQLLQGFGLDNLVFWRGLGDEAAELGAAFRWRGPDGSEVLALRQLGGYGNADRLGGGDPDAAAERVRQLTDRLGPRFAQVGLGSMLLMNGTDHRPIQRGLPKLLGACAERLPGSSFRISTVEEWVAHVRAAAGPLPTIEGELCGGGDIAVLRGVNSTRMWIKQANAAAERELFAAEALASLASLRGMRYPAGELAVAWRELLRNHPHDSICGCSIDAVHRDMRQRFETARTVAGVVRRAALAALAGVGPPWTSRPVAADERSVVNILPWSRRGAIELALPARLARTRSLVAESDGAILPVQRERGRALVSTGLQGLSATTLRLRRGTAPPGSGARAVSPRAIENERYRVEVASDGTLTVIDRAGGRTLPGLHLLEDCADRGDEYNFCPLEGEEPWTSRTLEARVRVVRAGPVLAELAVGLRPQLPERLAGDRRSRTRRTVACPVSTRVRLVAGVERVELRTVVENRAADHRLRVLFPVAEAAPEVRVEGHFAVLRRPARPRWNGRWSEPPQTTHHTLGMVAAGELALFARGLPEYEAVPRDAGIDLALTLLRCVGWLSRNDISTRGHHAGPPLETPEAQCLGRHAFEYAISLDGDRSDTTLVRAAMDYRHELEVGPAGIELAGLLGLEGDGFVLSALKQAEDGDGLVVRVFNPGVERTTLRMSGAFGAVERCRLDEAAGQAIGTELGLGPYEIATVRARRAGS